MQMFDSQEPETLSKMRRERRRMEKKTWRSKINLSIFDKFFINRKIFNDKMTYSHTLKGRVS